MYGNDDTQCPERAGTGANVTKLFIDSSVPSMGGVANWTSDETLEFKCKPPGFKPVSCKCENYKVSGGWVWITLIRDNLVSFMNCQKLFERVFLDKTLGCLVVYNLSWLDFNSLEFLLNVIFDKQGHTEKLLCNLFPLNLQREKIKDNYTWKNVCCHFSKLTV